MKSGEVVADRYRLDARLGVGGMGEVWKATHSSTGREFAIKFMHAHASSSASARQRFAREARVSAKINHPNVIDIFDAGEHDDGMLYLTMELLDGVSLADAFHVSPPLSMRDLLIVLHDTARALAAAHAAGIIHRDIKPANVFLHRDRATGLASAKILDFGISKFGGMDESNQTKTGAVLGSPRYMSPEQTRSAAGVDHRGDVWACGVILFEGLTGTWPHEGDSFSSLVVAICTVPPASIDLAAPDVPEPVRAIVRDCLKPLDQRVQSATELANRIAVALQDPTLAQRALARPLHPPSESIKAVSGVRVRPLLTTTGTDVGSDSLRITAEVGPVRSPESLRGTQPFPRNQLGLADSSEIHDALTTQIAPGLISSSTANGMPRAPGAGPRMGAPINGTIAMQPEAGARDAMSGTLDTLATTTLRESSVAPASGALPPSGATLEALPAQPLSRPRSVMRFAAALSVIGVGLVVAIVAVVSSSSSGDAAPAASAAAPPASAREVDSPPVEAARSSAPSTAEPATSVATAGAASASAAATGAPPHKAQGARAPAPVPAQPRGSKVKQLGSGL